MPNQDEAKNVLTLEDTGRYEPLPGATGMELNRVVTDAGTTELGGGFARFSTDGEFADWTLGYDEAFYVIEGRFDVESGGEVRSAGPGESLLIRRGTTVTYRGVEGTKVFFILYPRNWND